VPERVIDLVFAIRQQQRAKKGKDLPLWTMSRPTAWRMVKRVMSRAGIVGPMATSKGLRHGFCIAMIQKKVPTTVVRDLLDHSDTKITEIYLQAIGEERREMVIQVWE
jgi:integrase/recombinase XerD